MARYAQDQNGNWFVNNGLGYVPMYRGMGQAPAVPAPSVVPGPVFQPKRPALSCPQGYADGYRIIRDMATIQQSADPKGGQVTMLGMLGRWISGVRDPNLLTGISANYPDLLQGRGQGLIDLLSAYNAMLKDVEAKTMMTPTLNEAAAALLSCAQFGNPYWGPPSSVSTELAPTDRQPGKAADTDVTKQRQCYSTCMQNFDLAMFQRQMRECAWRALAPFALPAGGGPYLAGLGQTTPGVPFGLPNGAAIDALVGFNFNIDKDLMCKSMCNGRLFAVPVGAGPVVIGSRAQSVKSEAAEMPSGMTRTTVGRSR